MIQLSPLVLSRRDRRRKIKDYATRVLLLLAASVVIFPLLAVLFYIIRRAWPGLSWAFFVQVPKPVGEPGGGMANGIFGSLKMLGLASLFGIPWGVGAGLYLSEYHLSRWARWISFFCNLLASTPSIVVGVFIYGIFVVPMKTFSAYAGAASLALIMIPIIARSSEEILRLVPNSVREAGLALGISRWRVTLFVVLRGARGGIVTGVILALARVAGETAPLLFTALNNSFWSRGLGEPTASLPVQIYTYAISPFESWQQQAWVGAFVLVMMSLILNLSTRLMLRQKK